MKQLEWNICSLVEIWDRLDFSHHLKIRFLLLYKKIRQKTDNRVLANFWKTTLHFSDYLKINSIRPTWKSKVINVFVSTSFVLTSISWLQANTFSPWPKWDFWLQNKFSQLHLVNKCSIILSMNKSKNFIASKSEFVQVWLNDAFRCNFPKFFRSSRMARIRKWLGRSRDQHYSDFSHQQNHVPTNGPRVLHLRGTQTIEMWGRFAPLPRHLTAFNAEILQHRHNVRNVFSIQQTDNPLLGHPK